MDHERKADLGTLRGMVPLLNAATAEAGEVVSAVEHYLGEELGIGVSAASRPFDSQLSIGEGERELLDTSHLAFGRLGGRDRVFVLRARLEKTDGSEHFTKVVAEERTPWNSCSREVKLQSFAMLPELLGNLATRVEEVATQTTRTVQAVRDLLDGMRQGVPVAEDEPTPPPAEVVSLQDLTASTAPDLFKRPRIRAATGT